MYRIFVDNTIKEFQYNYEEEKNKFIVAFFKDGNTLRNNSRKDLIGYNFYICGRNLATMKYIIRKIPCYLYNIYGKSKCGERVGELEPSYNYGTHVDNYYEEFDEVINEFSDILKNQINYDIHDLWEDGLLDDDTYTLFHYDNPHCYYGKINEPYLIFAKEVVGSLQKEYITKKILLSCINKL